jgi:hypothetical protein
MSLSLTSKNIIGLGNRIGYLSEGTMSGAYPYGGESFNCETLFGIHNAEFVQANVDGGYRLKYDKANNKLKAYMAAPPIVYDELHAIDTTTGLITLNYPAAFIMNVSMNGGQNLAMRSTGIALASLSTSQCCLVSQMSSGTRTQLRCAVGLVPDLLTGSVNGGFTGNATGWTLGAGWAYDSNDIHRSAQAATTAVCDGWLPTPGKAYKVIISFNAFTAGSLTVTLGGVASTTAMTSDASVTHYITATTAGKLTLTPNAACACEVNTVYVILMEAKVTYVTQAWKEVWDNLVQDEAVTLATGANNLANKMLACMYVDQITATAAALLMVDEDDTAASGEVEIAFNAATAQLTVHADQNAKAAKVTYIKMPTSGFLYDRFVNNETATGSGAGPYLSTFDLPILLWSYTGCAPVNTGTTQKLIDFTATPEAGEGILDWFNRGTRGGGAIATGTPLGTLSNVTCTGAYVWGSINEIPVHDLEVPDGTDLDITSLTVMVIGN